jgi:transcriptional regulator of arginine metabolism
VKPRRQARILDIVRHQIIETQEQLAEALRTAGVQATQATVSRDMRELGLIKVPTGDGRQRYALPDVAAPVPGQRLMDVFRAAVITVEWSENIVVLHTLSAMADAVSEAVDSMRLPAVIGSLAGERTVFLVVRPKEEAPRVVAQLRAYMD